MDFRIVNSARLLLWGRKIKHLTWDQTQRNWLCFTDFISQSVIFGTDYWLNFKINLAIMGGTVVQRSNPCHCISARSSASVVVLFLFILTHFFPIPLEKKNTFNTTGIRFNKGTIPTFNDKKENLWWFCSSNFHSSPAGNAVVNANRRQNETGITVQAHPELNEYKWFLKITKTVKPIYLKKSSRQSLSGCTVPQTRTGGCPRRSRSTRCSATPWATLVRAEPSAPSWAAAAAAQAASTWTASTHSCRRTSCIWKAARTATRTESEHRGLQKDKCQKCSLTTTYLNPADPVRSLQHSKSLWDRNNRLSKLVPSFSFMAFWAFFFLYVQLGLFKHLAFYRSNLSLPLITFARVCFCSLLNCLDGVPRTFYHHLYTLVSQLIRWCFLSRWLTTLGTEAAPSVSGSSILLSLWNMWSLAAALFLPAGVPLRMLCCLSSWLCSHLDFFPWTIPLEFFPFLWKKNKNVHSVIYFF